MTKKQILFISAYNSSFVKKDIVTIEKKYNVLHPDLGDKATGFGIITLFIRIFSAFRKSALAFCWFADVRACIAVFLGRLLKKPVVVVVGGYELAWIPELNYGALRSRFAIWRVKYILQNATKILFVDQSLLIEAKEKLKLAGGNFEVLPTNFDPKLFPEHTSKENIILTVAITNTKQTAYIKGFPTFIRLSHIFPEWSFRIVGVDKGLHKWLRDMGGDNIEIIEKLDFSQLIKEYSSAKIYCQLSMREGLPNALCEAILCGCIPVGTRVNGIPLIIGENGFLCDRDNINEVKEALQSAIKSHPTKDARKRIIELFSIPQRANEINGLLERLL